MEENYSYAELIKEKGKIMNEESTFEEEIVVKPEDNKIFLTEAEVLSLTLSNEIISGAMKQMEITELKIHQLDLTKQILESKRAIEKQSFEESKNSGKRLLESLHMKYCIDINQKWGYNPQTREVVLTKE